MTFVQHFLLEECFDFNQTFSPTYKKIMLNRVAALSTMLDCKLKTKGKCFQQGYNLCISNIVRSILFTMLGSVLLTMLQHVARA